MDYFSTQLLIILYACLIWGLHASQSFTVNMTNQQYSSHFSAYIAEFNGKKCYVRPGSDVDACEKYCKFNYDYVPSLPFKNAQNYNPKTRLCQPKVFCPRVQGISLDQNSNKCIDDLLGTEVRSIDAPAPTNQTTTKVTVICQNGKVKTFYGKLDCQCDMGYGSLPTPYFGPTKSFMKCNQPLTIAVYFPNFLKIYYDESYDNLFPFAADSQYWIKLVQYYFRKIKYSIIAFFVPYQVQVVLLAIPPEQTFRPVDWIWLTWLVIFFTLLFIITLHQRCIVKLKELTTQSE